MGGARRPIPPFAEAFRVWGTQNAPPAKGMQKAIESKEAAKEQLDLPKSGPDEQIQPAGASPLAVAPVSGLQTAPMAPEPVPMSRTE